MNYSELSRREAHNLLLTHDEADRDEVGKMDERGEIIEPVDVLYYLDAYGDLSLAINCQGLPKDLPDRVVEEINEYDVHGGWHGKVQEIECAVCHDDLYEFDFRQGPVTIDKLGNDKTSRLKYVNDPAGYFWDTSGEHSIMCYHCRDLIENFSHDMDEHYGVKIFHGDRDSWYPFSYSGTVVRWDGEWYMGNKNCEDINLRTADGEDFIRTREVAKAFASPDSDDLNDLIVQLGWTEVVPRDIQLKTPGVVRTYKYAEEIIEGWASIEATQTEVTHPDFNFPYIIEDGKHLFFPEDKWDTVMYHLKDQILFNSGATEKLREHRDSSVGV